MTNSSAFAVFNSATGRVKWFSDHPGPPSGLPAGLAFVAVDSVKPNPADWDVLNGALVAQAPSLTENQAVKASAAKAYFAGLFARPKGFTYAGKLYQIDSNSQSQIAAMGGLARASIADPPGSPWDAGFYWIAADNSHVPMDAATTCAFSRTVAAYVSAAVLHLRSIKDAIAAATTQAALDAIDVTAGYPAPAS